MCNCEPVNLVWYPFYTAGGGIISGRCMKQRAQGQTVLTNSSYCLVNYWAGGYFRSPVSICQNPFWSYLIFNSKIPPYGGIAISGTNYAFPKCTNSLECPAYWTACMNIDGDSYTKCTPLPTLFYLNSLGYGFYAKSSYGQQCSLYLKCNEFKNLKCTNYYANATGGALPYGTCTCYGKYQYWNATVNTGTTAYGWGMCINGKRFL